MVTDYTARKDLIMNLYMIYVLEVLRNEYEDVKLDVGADVSIANYMNDRGYDVVDDVAFIKALASDLDRDSIHKRICDWYENFQKTKIYYVDIEATITKRYYVCATTQKEAELLAWDSMDTDDFFDRGKLLGSDFDIEDSGKYIYDDINEEDCDYSHWED